MTHQCKSCGGFCGKSGCERLNTNHPDYDKAGTAQREAFEAWAKRKGLDIDTRVPDAWGRPEYLRDIECMWLGYQAAQPAQVPDGWKLVPVEPTNEMNCAGNAYAELTANQPKGMWWWGLVYQAMLAAAPSTKEQGE